jgi:hypothetical protein
MLDNRLQMLIALGRRGFACQRRLNIPQKWRLEIPHFVALGVRF